MRYTSEQIKKIHENVNKIKGYLQTLQPQINERITIKFGKMVEYDIFDRDRECKITVDKDDIYGYCGGLYIEFERKPSRSVSSNVYEWFSYTVQLIEEWQYIKQEIHDEITRQQATIDAINNFEL